MPLTEKWTLADVLDFEALVAADERAADPSAIAERDAQLWQGQISPRLAANESSETAVVFHRWLEARRASGPLPGTWLTGAWRVLAGGAAGAGLVLGFIVAGGALYYHGTRPVNVAVFLAITVGIQWLFLAWSLLLILSQGFRSASERLLARLGESVGEAVAGALEHLSAQQRMRMRAEAATLRQLAGRNLQLLRWPPWIAFQGFGIAWNFGVLAALLARVVFTDVAFGWESTAAQSPGGMHALARALAAPWTWFAPGACPTLAQVEHSWFHYQSGVAALDRMATASWWPWLVGVVIFYGLLPRTALWIFFWTRLRAGLRGLTFEEPRHKAAWYRLAGRIIHADRARHEDGIPIGASGTPDALPKADSGCLLVAAPLAGAKNEIEHWVQSNLGWRLACSEVVEIDFPSGNDPALTRLSTALAEAPRWLIAVPAPFTAFSAFTQFVNRITERDKTSGSSKGFVLVVALDEAGKPKAPDTEWGRYWGDFLRAENTGCVTFSFTP